jgi:hypothetical protein
VRAIVLRKDELGWPREVSLVSHFAHRREVVVEEGFYVRESKGRVFRDCLRGISSYRMCESVTPLKDYRLRLTEMEASCISHDVEE